MSSIDIHENQAEISSLQSVTSDSTRLLTEKLSLVRELSCLKPEMEHLRSQAAVNQSLLSEKLALQRQLNAIQVELETERRSAQLAHAKEGKLQAEDAKLEIRIESLQADLLRERRQRERSERESQRVQTDWNNKKTTLESRLDAFRNKLRITKEQLKEAETELKKTQLSTNGLLNRSTDASEISRKRKAAQAEDESTIGTPGNPRTMKKIKKGVTLPGDKSTFSITPFLNRASSVALESFEEFSDKDHNEDMRASCDPLNDQGEEIRSASLAAIGVSEIHKKGGEAIRARKLLSTKSVPIENISPGNISTRNQKIVNSLARVNEIEENESIETAVPQSKKYDPGSVPAGMLKESVNKIKRKRKLLGSGLDKTLLEGEEEEIIKDKKIFLRRQNVGNKKTNISFKSESRNGLTSSAGIFRAISPLKLKK